MAAEAAIPEQSSLKRITPGSAAAEHPDAPSPEYPTTSHGHSVQLHGQECA